MFDDILLNAKTRQALEAFARQPKHALLLSSTTPFEKPVEAQHLAASILGVKVDDLYGIPQFLHIAKAKDLQNITVDNIRSIRQALRLKAPTATGKITRVVMIDGADNMNQEAQNALLKALEEPSQGTVFILSTHRLSRLLPTITSRCQIIKLLPVSLSEAANKYASSSQASVTAAWHLSSGNPGVLDELLSTSSARLTPFVDQAKQIIKMDKYQRIIALDLLSQNKEQALGVLSALDKLLQVLYHSAVASGKGSLVTKLLANSRLVKQAIIDLNSNVASRVSLLNLALKLKS